jgi:hypothetical protein
MQTISFQHPEDAIIATLAFFSLFDYPLTAEEIQQYCLGASCDLATIQQVGAQHSSIIHQGNFYALHGRTYQFKQRHQQESLVYKRVKKAYRYGRLLRFIPFVRGVFLCNNLSFGIAKEGGDIDLFIVSDVQHLWLARFLVTVFFHVLRVRRHGNNIQDRICLSFFTTEDHLDLSSILIDPQDMYLAYWVLGLKPIVGWRVYHRILQENQKWLTKYFNIVNLQSKWEKETAGVQPYECCGRLQRVQEWLWKTFIGRWGEKKIITFQQRHMHRTYQDVPDKKGIIISEHMLKFHNEDRRAFYSTQWEKIFTSFSSYR